MKTTKKIMASALALTMAASAGVAALADNEPIKTSGGSATVPVTITSALKEGSTAENPQYDAPVFRVTLPASLPLTINANGSVTPPSADAFQIINGSAGSVKVTNVAFEDGGTWEFADYDSEFDEMQVNAHKLGLSLTANGKEVKTGDTGDDLKPNWTIAKNGKLGITAAAKASAVSTTVTENNAASVVFTVGWNAAERRTISFTIGNKSCQALENTTWRDLIRENQYAYGIDWFVDFIDEDDAEVGTDDCGEHRIEDELLLNGQVVKMSDTIVENGIYTWK